jgi:hypothetical protein
MLHTTGEPEKAETNIYKCCPVEARIDTVPSDNVFNRLHSEALASVCGARWMNQRTGSRKRDTRADEIQGTFRTVQPDEHRFAHRPYPY